MWSPPDPKYHWFRSNCLISAKCLLGPWVGRVLLVLHLSAMVLFSNALSKLRKFSRSGKNGKKRRKLNILMMGMRPQRGADGVTYPRNNILNGYFNELSHKKGRANFWHGPHRCLRTYDRIRCLLGQYAQRKQQQNGIVGYPRCMPID